MDMEDDKLSPTSPNTDETTAVVPTDDPALPARFAPPVDAEALVQGLRMLQQRIPGFTHLTRRQGQARTSTAYLPPEFIETGLRVAEVWPTAVNLAQRSVEDMQREADEVTQWDQVERELAAVVKGIAAANLERRSHLGRTILRIYQQLGATIRHAETMDRKEDLALRPYYDAMRRAWLKGRKRRKPADSEPEGTPTPG